MKVGILGAGQLAQLLAHSAYTLGIETLCFSAQPNVPAARLSPLFIGELTDQDALIRFAKACDVITLENENIDMPVLDCLNTYCPVLPGRQAIAVAQDRLNEKTLFQELGIATPAFIAIHSLEDIKNACKVIGLPAILKTRRFGYDGKGQVMIRQAEEIAAAWETIGTAPAILEAFIPFKTEVSLIGARNGDGHTIFYPLIKNTHEAGILRVSESPYQDPKLQALAQRYMNLLFDALNYVGVLAFEFFVKDHSLIANEIAPRVHNSGHLTIEGFNISQFETHLRSILNFPLIEPVLRTPTKMLNVIGTFPTHQAQDYQHAHIYNYGKTPTPGRKLGHITEF